MRSGECGIMQIWNIRVSYVYTNEMESRHIKTRFLDFIQNSQMNNYIIMKFLDIKWKNDRESKALCNGRIIVD
jgi:hypothetical protein